MANRFLYSRWVYPTYKKEQRWLKDSTARLCVLRCSKTKMPSGNAGTSVMRYMIATPATALYSPESHEVVRSAVT